MANPTARRRRVNTLAKKLLLVVFGVVVALLALELFLRIIGFKNLNPYIVDKDVGFSLRPRAEGWWDHEGVTYIKINSDGLRDREHIKPKPPGVLRIAVLGDSFTEAFEVNLEQAWWAVMEKQLENCNNLSGRKVEVINFGVSGFSTGRELITLRNRVWQYSPDIIVLNFTTINDVKDNSKVLNQEYAAEPIPYFVHRDGKLVLDDDLLKARNNSLSFRLQQTRLGRILGQARDYVRILGLIDRARLAYSQHKKIAEQAERQTNVRAEMLGVEDNIYVEPVEPDWIEAWRVTEDLLITMRDEVRSKGAKFLVVTGTNGTQLWPDPAYRQKRMDDLKVSDLEYPDKRIKTLGEKEGFAVMNLVPAMRQYADERHVFLHGQRQVTGYGHWNQEGHRIAGELIAQQMCTDILSR